MFALFPTWLVQLHAVFAAKSPWDFEGSLARLRMKSFLKEVAAAVEPEKEQ